MSTAASSESYEIQGKNVRLPAVVRDASSGSVMYLVDRAAAQALVPDAFETVEAAPGKTQLTLVIVDYRDNDLGDYYEVGVIFFVKPKDDPDAEVGSYIHALPVNQSFTCEAGCRIWGFPKTVEEIEFAYSEGSATCKLTMGGQHVLTLTVPRGGDGHTEDTDAVGYTMIEGVAHTNVFTRGGSGEKTTPGGEGVVLELGPHRVADELRTLGVDSATPLLSNWSEHMTGRFGPSVKL